MALVSAKEMLSDARARKYAVPMFDVNGYEMVRCLAETAERMKSPVMLACIVPEIEANALDYLTALMDVAARKTSVPVAIHLDHSDSFENCARCIKAGFNSVMIDASAMPFAENVRITKEVVDFAHARGVTVEAELGHVGDGICGGGSEGKSAAAALTDVSEVEKFVEATNVDALAVSIGTAHGTYVSAPTLDIPRLAAINAVSRACLVLHGGSGTPEDQLKAAVANGISKVNVYTDLVKAYNSEMKKEYERMKYVGTWQMIIAKKPIEAMGKKAAEYMEMFGSANKA